MTIFVEDNLRLAHEYRCCDLLTFKLDSGHLDLVALSMVYFDNDGSIVHEHREWRITAHWLTSRLQRWFGTNQHLDMD